MNESAYLIDDNISDSGDVNEALGLLASECLAFYLYSEVLDDYQLALNHLAS